jgi:hypothetical protein
MTGHPAGIKLHRELCELLGVMLMGVNHMVVAALHATWPVVRLPILNFIAAVSMTVGRSAMQGVLGRGICMLSGH